MSKEEYAETFCREKRIRKRIAVYVSEESHYALKWATALFRFDYHTTTSSLADAIISHHFKANRELLSGLGQEESALFLNGFAKKNDDDPDDADDADDTGNYTE